MAELTAAKAKREGYLTAVTTKVGKLKRSMTSDPLDLGRIQLTRDQLGLAWEAYKESQQEVLAMINEGVV